MAFSIRLSEEEKNLVTSYAELHSMTVGEAFKQAIFEKIEDEFDLSIAAAAYQEYLKDSRTYPHDEVWRELLK